MSVRRTVVIGALLGLGVVVAAGTQGPARFSGLRFGPDLEAGPAPMPAPPTGPAQPPPSRAPAVPGSGGPVEVSKVLLWIAIGVVVLVAGVLLWRWLARRPPRSTTGLPAAGPILEPPPEPAPEPEPPVLRRGVEEALRLLDDEPEPRNAVLAAWLGLQRAAEDSGVVRGAAETPTEFTSRILDRVFADDGAVATLLALYLRVRFGDHPVTAADVAKARAALADLARTWDDGASRRPVS